MANNLAEWDESAPSESSLLTKLRLALPLSEAESQALAELPARMRHLDARSDLLEEGKPSARIVCIEDGWAIRYKLLPDGRRQILNFVLPGDFVGLREQIYPVCAHSVTTLTEATVWEVDQAALIGVFQRHPRLTLAIAWSSAREEAMLEEQIVRIGRRNAYERLAHLFMELLRRLQAVGRAGVRSYELPVTQEILADLLGLSVVHVNRTLKRFRAAGLLDICQGRISIRNVDALARAAGFEAGYLAAGADVAEAPALLAESGEGI